MFAEKLFIKKILLFVHFKNSCYICAVSRCSCTLVVCRKGGMTYIIKAFAKRFGFDDVRTSQPLTISQKQSNSRCPVGWLYIIIYVYKLFSVGRLCCSFRLIGQCEGLYIVERATSIGSTFFLCLSENHPKQSCWQKSHATYNAECINRNL